MRKSIILFMVFLVSGAIFYDDQGEALEDRSNVSSTITGYQVSSDLLIRATIHTVEGPINAVWKTGGEDTMGENQVIWGHFYASPDDVTWGSENNPELFVKIWFDASGRVDVNYFHVSVPDIDVFAVYEDRPLEGATTMDYRYVRLYYNQKDRLDQEPYDGIDEQFEDGYPFEGDSPVGVPSKYHAISSEERNDLKIAAIIHTYEGAIDAEWRQGGQGITDRGDEVIWGHFYASPDDVPWGSRQNPGLFVKIWMDASGRSDVNFFHVSVPNIEGHSGNQKGTTIMADRYIRHEYLGDHYPDPEIRADFQATPTSGEAPLKVKFTDESTEGVTDWLWKFGDYGESIRQSPEYIYESPGTYTVTLTVTDAGGASSSQSKTITVTEKEAPPTAKFRASPTSGYAPLTVSFTDQSEGTITSRSWDFGDGARSTSQNPSHTYSSAGGYTVTLTVKGPGGSDSKQTIIQVKEVPDPY